MRWEVWVDGKPAERCRTYLEAMQRACLIAEVLRKTAEVRKSSGQPVTTVRPEDRAVPPSEARAS